MTTIPSLDIRNRPSPDTDMRWVRWLGSMLDGSTSPGTLTIKADRTTPLLDDDPDQPRSILPNPIMATVQEVSLVEDIGTRKYMYVAVPVPATDDPDLVGHGFTYTADIKLKNGAAYGPYTFTVPLSTPATGLWLNKVAAATPAPGEPLPQITKAQFDDLSARILVLESMGGAGGGQHAASHAAGGVDAVSLDGAQITTGRVPAARLGGGMAGPDTALFGDGQWKSIPSTGGGGSDPDAVKLTGAQTVAGVKTFTDAPVVPDGAFPIAKTSGLANALAGKAPLDSPTFTGTVAGVTKGMVGLGNVDNTADSAKSFTAAQITTGVFGPARLGAGPADSSTVLFGDGTWKAAPSGGGGGGSAGTPIVRFANADGSWPNDLPTPTVAAPLILYADVTNFPDATAYPAPPSHVRNAYMRYHGPEWVESTTSVVASVTGATGRRVTFDATATTEVGVTVSSYSWAFSDGETATGKTVTHTFPTIGSVAGTVTVLDSNGLTSAPSTANTTVTEGLPTVTLAASVNGLAVTWTATAADPEQEPLTYSWTGTDTLTGTTASVPKTYPTPGAKSATVTVTDSKGRTANATHTVTLVAPDGNGVVTADTFTTAAAGAAAVLARATEIGSLGGTSMPPAFADGTLNIDSGTLAANSNARVLYPTGVASPRVRATITAAAPSTIADLVLMDDHAGNSVRARFRQNGAVFIEKNTAAPSSQTADIAATGSWAVGDRMDARLVGDTVTVDVYRASALLATYSGTVPGGGRPSPSASYCGLGTGGNSSNVRFDDMVIGQVV